MIGYSLGGFRSFLAFDYLRSRPILPLFLFQILWSEISKDFEGLLTWRCRDTKRSDWQIRLKLRG